MNTILICGNADRADAIAQQVRDMAIDIDTIIIGDTDDRTLDILRLALEAPDEHVVLVDGDAMLRPQVSPRLGAIGVIGMDHTPYMADMLAQPIEVIQVGTCGLTYSSEPEPKEVAIEFISPHDIPHMPDPVARDYPEPKPPKAYKSKRERREHR